MICHNCQKPKKCVARVQGEVVCRTCRAVLATEGFMIRPLE